MRTLNIKDPEAHRLAAAIAQETGETMTRVVTEALRERFERLPSRQRKASVDELCAIAQRAAAWVKRPYQDHADLLYDEHGLPQMILDTSAVTAILLAEPEGNRFIQLIHDADQCRISAANFVELCMVIESQLGPEAARQLDTFFRRAEIGIEAVTVEQAHLARQAFLDFGKGRHPAQLNFGDCFAYALAKATGEPLLFKGSDFSKTDIRSVDMLDQ